MGNTVAKLISKDDCVKKVANAFIYKCGNRIKLKKVKPVKGLIKQIITTDQYSLLEVEINGRSKFYQVDKEKVAVADDTAYAEYKATKAYDKAAKAADEAYADYEAAIGTANDAYGNTYSAYAKAAYDADEAYAAYVEAASNAAYANAAAKNAKNAAKDTPRDYNEGDTFEGALLIFQ